MWGNMGRLNFVVLFLYTAFNNFYLYELFWGDMNNATIKGLFYGVTFLIGIWTAIDEILGYKGTKNFQTNIIIKLTIWANFGLFSLTQLNMILNPILCLFLLNTTVLAISVSIFRNLNKYGYFK